MRSKLNNFKLTGAVAALGYAILVVVPISFVALSSFKEHADIVRTPVSLPSPVDIANFAQAQERANLIPAMLNTLYILAVAEGINLLLSYLAAYAIARIRILEARIVEGLFGLGFLIPPFAIMLPIFLLSVNLGLLYEPMYLILFYAVARLPLAIILLATVMKQIPQDFQDSARIDGASTLQVIAHIFFPLTTSTLVTVVILNFLFVWNEYLFALVLLPGGFKTVQLALPLLRGERTIDYGLIAAGVVISLIPIYTVFAFFQRKIIGGLTSGGIKG